MSEKINTTFTGTVDEFLNHCSKLDFDISDEELKNREYEFSIDFIMKEASVSREEAIELYNMIAFEEVKKTVDKLVEDGLLEITGYSADGEPLFGTTELGKKSIEELNKKKQ